jgi:heat shock protein HslJ
MRITVRHLAIPVVLTVALLVAGCDLLGGSDSLTGKNWQWSASTTTAPASQSVVPDPENYTLEFVVDGTFISKVDCNQLSGTYTSPGDGALTIAPGPMTLAACPPGSLSDLYVAGLAATTSYAIANGQLTLTTTDGTMTFE